MRIAIGSLLALLVAGMLFFYWGGPDGTLEGVSGDLVSEEPLAEFEKAAVHLTGDDALGRGAELEGPAGNARPRAPAERRANVQIAEDPSSSSPTIQGHVFFEDREVVPGIVLTAYAGEDRAGERVELGHAISGSDGAFAIQTPDGWSGKHVQLEQSSSPRLGQDRRLFLRDTWTDIEVLLPGCRIEVRVLNVRREVMANAIVRALHLNAHGEMTPGAGSFFARTNDDGVALVDIVNPLTVSLLAESADGSEMSDRVTLFVVRGIAGNRVELMLGRRDHGYVHVHVVDQSENPVSNYAVMILPEAGLGETTYKVSSGSPPIIAALPVGRYKVQLAHVLAGGVALYRARDEASTEVKNTGDVAEVRFKVTLGAALAFDIKLHAGMDGGHVEYMKEGGLKVNWTRFRHLMTTEPGGTRVSESVSKDGRHTTGVLDPGVYKLRLVDRHDLDKVHWEGSADLQQGEVVTVEIDLSSGEMP